MNQIYHETKFSKPSLRRYGDWLRAGRLRGLVSSPGRVKNVLFSTSSRPTLGTTQPPIKCVSGLFPRGLSCRGVKLTTHLQLVPRSRKCGSIPLIHKPSWFPFRRLLRLAGLRWRYSTPPPREDLALQFGEGSNVRQ
jgi:hypothetical protein